VLLLDEHDRILLMQDSDLGLDPVRRWWSTPGGGVDDGESLEDAAVRELFEETGLEITAAALAGPLLRRQVLHGYSDKVVDQVEVFFVARVPTFDVDTSGHTEEEQRTVAELRWWDLGTLRLTTDDVWPRDLHDLVDLAGQPGRWRGGPVLGPAVEESTVPVG
jgi:8-oxo-dGTP pyrophosphatase MutT (NUDIX family)